MVKADLWHEIHSRFKLRESKMSIARTLGLSILTVRKILRQTRPQAYERQKSESALLSPYKDYILRRLAAVRYCAQAIFEELRVRGYTGSYDLIKRFVSPLRAEASIEANWHETIGHPTLADAILDRLVHNAYKIPLKGESMRKKMKSLTQSGH